MTGNRRGRPTAARALAGLTVFLLWAGTAGAGPGQAAIGGDSGGGSPSLTRLGCRTAVEFDPSNFPARPVIDNRFLPLVPGHQLILRGRSNSTGQPNDHEVRFTVTDLTKMIDGVPALVVYDVDRTAGVLSERELAFFAQDLDGNVWNLGEYPEEFEDGAFVGADNTWIAGQADAVGGIHMLAEPTVSNLRYVQGFAPDIDFFDCAQVIAKDQRTTVPAGTFRHLLVTDETSPLDPQGGSQQKYHAPGVGIVRIGFANDPEGEELKLVRSGTPRQSRFDAIRARAMRVDLRGYRISEVYGATGPATLLPPA